MQMFFFSDLKILVHTSFFNESFLLQRLGAVCSWCES